jgi:hypothetical protein
MHRGFEGFSLGSSAYAAAERVERQLHRSVHVTIRTVEQWEHAESDPFLLEVQRRPLVEIDRDAEDR